MSGLNDSPVGFAREVSITQRTIVNNLPAGHMIGKQYRILEKTGSGGMGTVYKCLDVWLRRVVAVKVLHRHLAGRDKWLFRFQQEARAISRLSHEGIIRIHDIAMDAENPYIVMDFVEGENLEALLHRNGALDVAQAIALMSQVADILVHAHAHGVVHRDLKPSNIFLCQGTKRVKILDFGIAKLFCDDDLLNSSPKLTATGEIFGTPAYMSPEQALSRPVDGRSDQYAFGCVLYECLTGAPPFSSNSFLDLMFQHVNDSPVSLDQASLGKRFPVWLERAVFRMLAKKPHDRFENMEATNSALTPPAAEARPVDELHSLIGKAKRAHKKQATFFSWKLLPDFSSPAVQTWSVLVGVVIGAFAWYLFCLGCVAEDDKPGKHLSGAMSSLAPARASNNLVSTGEAEHRAAVTIDYAGADKDWLLIHGAANHQFEKQIFSNNIANSADMGTPDEILISDDAMYNLKKLKALNSLSLHNCIELTDNSLAIVAQIQTARHFALRLLDISNTGLGDEALKYAARIRTLQNLSALRDSNISGTGISYLASLPELHALYLAGNRGLKEEAFKNLGELRHLSVLELSDTNCRGRLHYLTGVPLTALKVDNCNLSDADILSISKIKSIQELYLQGNAGLTDASIDAIMTMPKLRLVSFEEGYGMHESAIQQLRERIKSRRGLVLSALD